jgi:hypothetical protein
MSGFSDKNEIKNLIRSRKDLASKMAGDVQDKFIDSIKLDDGRIVHMFYGEIESLYTSDDFIKFLSALNIDQRSFAAYRDNTCIGEQPVKRCEFSRGHYCDEHFCRNA